MIATPVVPDLVRAELGGAEGHFARSGRCVFCDIVEQELAYLAEKFQPKKATIIVSDPRTGFILGRLTGWIRED